MKKHEIYSGVVEELRFPNKGIVTVVEEEEAHKVLVKNTLPGQEISFRLTKNKKSKKEGNLLEVVKQADHETEEPFCPHFKDCGGCAYQTLSYEGQRDLKLSQVQALMDTVEGEIPLHNCEASPSEKQYRNKMEFSFGNMEKDGELTLGLHKRGSFYDIVPVHECQIICEDYRKIIKATNEYFVKEKVPFLHKKTHEGYLRHLMIRRGETRGELLICLVTTSQMNLDLEPYKELLLNLNLEGTIVGILQIINDSLADVVQADETKILFGKDYFYEELLGLQFKVTPFSFFQTNSKGAEVLYEKARSYIGEIKDKVIFDLYSGTGTIAQVLAPVAKKVIGVEIVEEAVVAAKENALDNGLTNCDFIAGDVLKVIDEIKDKPDFIVLDPPREGIHPKALPKIIAFDVKRIVYISCKPTSLQRDLPSFLEAGYTVEKADCVDMFPWTRGIETIVLLQKQDM